MPTMIGKIDAFFSLNFTVGSMVVKQLSWRDHRHGLLNKWETLRSGARCAELLQGSNPHGDSRSL